MAKEKKAPETQAETPETPDTQETQQTAEAPAPEKKEKKKKEKAASAQETLQKALDEKKDQYLRLAAEYDNFRKRSQKEKEALYAECKADVVKTLLTAIDNLERCVASDENTPAADYRKGVEMTYKQFAAALEKLGIEPFGEPGDAFDPNLHNAVMHEADDTQPENTVTKVLMKGYKIGDKLIRPAMVAVDN